MSTTNDAAFTATRRSSVDDWRGLGDLITLTSDRLTEPVEGVHHAIADRLFGLAGGDGTQGHFAHRLVTTKIYSSIRWGGSAARASLAIGARAVERQRPVQPLWSSSIGAGVQAAANALWGDEFDRRGSPMHAEMGIRDSGGLQVGTDTDSLRQEFPAPTHRLAVLLHGLGRTEHCWNQREDDSGDFVGLPSLLKAEGFTPLLLRYNTGRQVSDNGAALASVLEEVTANWPSSVDEIALVGHSMGGLVARSALHAGRSADHEWTLSARHLVALGTPHFGSPIEKSAHLASLILEKAPLSRPLGEFVDGRSAGIKDMRHGIIHKGGLGDRDPDTTMTHTSVVPRVEGVRQHHAATVVTHDASHPIGVLVGDLVVRVSSATGVGSHGRVESDDVRVFGGLNHMAMLHDDAVLSQVREWLSPSTRGTTEAKP